MVVCRPPVTPQSGVPAHIRTFRRRGRMTDAKRGALGELGPRHLVELAEVTADGWPGARPGSPRVLDLGFGDGEATVAFARSHPAYDVLAVEVHRPGIATLLQWLDAEGIDNVTVHDGDAVDVLARLTTGSLAEVHVFFPDPWPKVRHHARRIVRPDIVRRWAELLAPAGVLHLATDWAEYATKMRAVVADDGAFDAPVEDRAGRVVTKYERLGLAADRSIVDLRFRRR